MASNPGLLISEIFTNPSGDDSPFEYVELIATQAINFSATPYSVVFANNGTANSNGWIAGGNITYGFSITSGSVNPGDVVYVGGSSMSPTGTKLRTINTGNTAGDRFGNAATVGVLGNGGNNADGVAVFNVNINNLTSSTIPVDALFFGTGTGNAVVSGGSAGYQLPVNDRYNGGKLESNSYLAPDPAANQAILATGTFNTSTNTFTTSRNWNLGSATATSAITLNSNASGATPTIQEATTTTLVNLNTTTGAVSGVINDPTDPARTLGIDFILADADTPIGNLTVTATSSNQSVVANANLTLTGTGANRNLKINPTGVGLADITVTVSDGTNNSSYTINYAASAASVTPATSRFLTGTSDASTAIAIDSNFMLVGDDENQVIRVYDRQNSGLPVASFDFTSSLGLTDISDGIPREVDIEASTRIGNRIYWLGSLSNSASGNSRPNRNRLFATDVSGTGATTNLTYIGRYDNLRANLISWGDANGYNFTASAATGKIPEDSNLDGFNVEGLTIAPNGTTAYVAFRAPNVPTSNRTRALIAPINNFTDLVTGSATTANIGSPIELDLGGRGIRSIERNSNGQYLIIAGPADSATGTAPKDFRLYTWTGNPTDAPVLSPANLTALQAGGSFESIVEVPNNLTGTSQIQLLVDNGDNIWYNNGTASKELAERNFQKFRSDIVTINSTSVINGTLGRDTLTGTSGSDVITGSQGADNLTGGSGNDFFVYNSIRDAGDTITDFEVGIDKIVLTQLWTSLGLSVPDYSTATTQGYLGFSTSGGNTTILIDSDGSGSLRRPVPFIIASGVSQSDLANANNFVF
jgi:hypothetical protein